MSGPMLLFSHKYDISNPTSDRHCADVGTGSNIKEDGKWLKINVRAMSLFRHKYDISNYDVGPISRRCRIKDVIIPDIGP